MANVESVRIHAPGRVNLIGEHTDYTGGLAFPIAIDRGITLTGTRLDAAVDLVSDDIAGAVHVDLPYTGDPSTIEPGWGAFVGSVAKEMRASHGIDARISSDIPAGAGLSSSAALECAVALALGFDGTPLELAQLTQRAEHGATGVPTGIMDQLCIASATAGHATMIDCDALTVVHVPVPDDLRIIVRFVAHRTLADSAYTDRVAECARAESEVGPLRTATLDDVERIVDDVVRRRARHVVSENQRVRDFAAALATSDYDELGRLMVAGHASLRDDYETSTAAMDEAVELLNAEPGVFGARMTGAGFGGCVVALARHDAELDGWIVSPSPGARALPADA